MPCKVSVGGSKTAFSAMEGNRAWKDRRAVYIFTVETEKERLPAVWDSVSEQPDMATGS